MIEMDNYLKAKQEVFDHVGYVEDWRILPLLDGRSFFWAINGSETSGDVVFADTETDLIDGDGNRYGYEIYTQQHLPRWVYRGEKYTMVVADTHCDDNKVLFLLDNSKERVLQ